MRCYSLFAINSFKYLTLDLKVAQCAAHPPLSHELAPALTDSSLRTFSRRSLICRRRVRLSREAPKVRFQLSLDRPGSHDLTMALLSAAA